MYAKIKLNINIFIINYFLSGSGLFKYVRPFCGHQGLKGGKRLRKRWIKVEVFQTYFLQTLPTLCNVQKLRNIVL